MQEVLLDMQYGQQSYPSLPSRIMGGNSKMSTLKKTFDSEKDKTDHSISKTRYVYFLIIAAFLNALTNCVLPSTQTFPCMPYGISAYHLTAVLYNIANPVSCFIILFRSAASCFVITILSFLGSRQQGLFCILQLQVQLHYWWEPKLEKSLL